jgi:hypothetical protein
MSDDEQPKQQKRVIPQNDLDFNMQLTNPAWGKSELTAKAQDSLSKTFYLIDATTGQVALDEEGNPIVHHEDDYWARLGFLTRDWRLSNLNTKDYERLRWWADFATATNQYGYKRSTAYCISQIAPTLELSQSKGGFLREILNTLIQRNTNISEEPNKKSLFGVGKGTGQK